jgi:hypothetical protein
VTTCWVGFDIHCVHLIVLCGLIAMLTPADGVGLPVPIGVWGGEHIRLVVTESGGQWSMTVPSAGSMGRYVATRQVISRRVVSTCSSLVVRAD